MSALAHGGPSPSDHVRFALGEDIASDANSITLTVYRRGEALNYQLDEHGFLYDPWVHDGDLTGITVAGKDVTLGLKNPDKQEISLTLSSTTELLATNFQLGNIVNRIRLSRGVEVDLERLSLVYPPPHPSVAAHFHNVYSRVIDQKREAILMGELTFVELTSSYGCDIVALCEQVSVSR